MFTEDELRDALQHSAGRADRPAEPSDRANSDHGGVAVLAPPRPEADHRPARRWRRVALPAIAAATVVAAAITTVVVTSGDGPHRDVAAPPSAAAHPSPNRAPTPVRRAPVIDTSAVVDLVQAGASGGVEYDLHDVNDPQVGAGTLRKSLGGTETISLTVVPKSSPHLDAHRIPRDHPVPIAGTTGYYSKFKLFPIDGDHKRFSDKWSARWTIAFRTPHGDWAFAYFDSATPGGGSVDSPARIVKAYDQLHASYVAGRSRLPYRLTYLPTGVKFGSVGLEVGWPGAGDDSVQLNGPGTKSIFAQVLSGKAATLQCADRSGRTIVCPDDVRLKVGKYVIDINVQGYSHAEAKRILAGLRPARNLDDPSTYFTLADALR